MTATAFEPAFRPSSSIAAFVIDEEITNQAGSNLDLNDTVHGTLRDLKNGPGQLVTC